MSNVLDLKHQQPGTPPEPVVPVEVPELSVEPEPEFIETIASEEPMDDEEEVEALLADTTPPDALSWEAHHPLQGHARQRHFILSVGLVVIGVVVSLWQRSPVVFLVMLAGAATLELREHFGKPVAIEVDEQYVSVNGQRYEHATFASFHIHRMPDDTLELSLKSDRRYLPHMRLPLGGQDPYELHAVLAQYIPEGEHKIPLVEYLLRKPRKK